MSIATARTLLTDTFQAYTADKAERLGAALAYYAVFSLAPLLVLALAVARLVYGQQSMQAQAALLDQVEGVLGTSGRTLVEGVLSEAAVASGQGTLAVLMGSVLLLVGATAFFARLQDAMNTIWNATPVYSGWWGLVRSRLLSLLLVLAVGAGLVASLAFNAAFSSVADMLGVTVGGYLVERIGTLVLLTGLCALLFRTLPDASVEWADVWPGAVGTALLISLGTIAIGWYLGQTAAVSAYGAAGALAALLLWIYYAAQIFFLGAEFTCVYAEHRRFHTAPALSASPPSSPEPVPASPQSRRRWPGRLAWMALGMLIALFWRR